MKRNRSNVDICSLVEHEGGTLLYDGAEGCVAREDSGGAIMTDITDGEALGAVLRALDLTDVRQAVVKSRSAQEIVSAMFGLHGSERCTQWVYDSAEPPQLPACEIRTLEMQHVAQAAAHYHLFDDAGPYLQARIAAGRMWGVFDGGALAGFIGTHDGGSMGMLEVLPQFRRRGYGLALERFLIAWHLARGWTPFGHVIDGNEASLQLQKKAGMACAELPTIWLF